MQEIICPECKKKTPAKGLLELSSDASYVYFALDCKKCREPITIYYDLREIVYE